MSRHLISTLVLLVMISTTAAIAGDLVGDRPDFTESAATITPGRVQFEAGFTSTNAGEIDMREIGEILARIGLDNRTELRVGLGSWVDIEAGPNGVDGLDDLELGFKRYLMTGDGSAPELALIVAATLPTGGENITANETQPLAIVAAEWTLSDHIGLGTNLGWTSAYDGERFSSLWLSAALGYAVNDRVGFFVEGYAFDKESSDGDATTYGDMGFTYLVGDDLQFDVRIGSGFGDADETYTGVGLVLRI